MRNFTTVSLESNQPASNTYLNDMLNLMASVGHSRLSLKL